MNLRISALLVAALLPGAVSARAQQMPPSIEGSWRIIRMLPTSNVACWDAARGRTLIGTRLRYTTGAMEWKGGRIPVSDAFTRVLRPQDFLHEYSFDPAQVGLREPKITEVDLQHDDADITGATTEVPGDTILLAGPGRIIVSACGVYFEAVRAK